MKNDQTLRILFVEDRPEDAEIAIRELKREDLEFNYLIVQTETDFIEALKKFDPTLIVSDYSMPEFDGMSALKIAKSYAKHTPFIILTGSINEETAVTCMKAGANDYVLKEQTKRLPFAIKEALEKNRTFLEKMKMADRLEESESKYRSYIDNSPNGVFVIDTKGHFLDVNPMLSKLTGYSIEQLLRMEVADLLMDEKTNELAKIKFKALIKTGKMSMQMQYRKQDTSACWWQVDAVMINPQKALAFATDISEQKKTEAKLKDALEKAKESDRLKSAFLANVSHEIRTPMNGIMGFSSLLKRADLNTKKQHEYIDIIERSGKRMLNTINDLVDISRIESGQVKITKKNMNFNEQLAHLYDFFKPEIEGKGLKFFYKPTLNDSKAIIDTDEEKFYAIISNYIKNAIKYTDKGEIHVGYNIQKDLIEFYVRDTGIGISEDKHHAVFERFVQADLSITKPYEGSGLGLAISKAYAEMIGGSVQVDSIPGKGSVFYLRLPFKSIDFQHGQSMLSKDHLEQKRVKLTDLDILIVEDDEASVLYMKIILETKCHSLQITRTGVEALEFMREHPETDLILMDVRMPDMDGYTATRMIREFNKNVLILAQTAYAMESDRIQAIKAGCNAYISKPIREEVLFPLIDTLLHNRKQ